MLNLDTIVGAGDTLLPSEGFWGFLLDHWIAIAIAVMIVGFVIDQVLYVVRYRPQDSWRAAYYGFRRFLTERFGVKPAEEPPEPEEEYNPLEHSGLTERREEPEPVIRRAQPAPAPLREKPVIRAPIQRQTPHDPPTIRRGGAQYSPHRAAPDAVDDEPLVVRAAHTPPPVSAEPTTQNGNNRTE